MTDGTLDPGLIVDSRDSTCPGPLMDLIGKIKSADSGKVIELKTTDKGSKNDVPDWLNKAGHELLKVVNRGEYWNLYARKS